MGRLTYCQKLGKVPCRSFVSIFLSCFALHTHFKVRLSLSLSIWRNVVTTDFKYPGLIHPQALRVCKVSLSLFLHFLILTGAADLSILVIDDMKLNLKVTKMLLSRLGFNDISLARSAMVVFLLLSCLPSMTYYIFRRVLQFLISVRSIWYSLT